MLMPQRHGGIASHVFCVRDESWDGAVVRDVWRWLRGIGESSGDVCLRQPIPYGPLTWLG